MSRARDVREENLESVEKLPKKFIFSQRGIPQTINESLTIAPLDTGDILQDALVVHQRQQLSHFTFSQAAVLNFHFLEQRRAQNLQ